MLDGMRQHASSWIIKVIFAIIIAVFVLAFGSGTMSNRASGGAVLAYVDETPILIKNFNMEYQRAIEGVRRQNPGVSADALETPAFKQQVLNRMVNETLLASEVQRLGITVSKDEVRSRILQYQVFRNKDNAFDQEIYKQVLRSQHITPGVFEADIRRQLSQEKLFKYLNLGATVSEKDAYELFKFQAQTARVEYQLLNWRDFADKVTPSDDEIEAYYKEHSASFTVPAVASFEYLSFTPSALAASEKVADNEIKAYYEANTAQFKTPEMVSARHILLKLDPSASDEDVKAAEGKAQSIEKKLARGGDFAALAKKYSEGPTASRGGDLGWFGRGAMVPEFEKAAFGLKEGAVSKPVRTQFGLHIIKLEKKRAAGVKTLDEAREQITQVIAEEKAAGKLSDLLDQAIEQIMVGDKMDKIGDSLGMAAKSTGMVTENQLASQLGLKGEDLKTVFTLVVGSATDTPVQVNDGYLLASKVKETPEHVAPLSEVKPSIVEALKRRGAITIAQEKAQELLKKYSAAKDVESSALKMSTPFSRQGFIAGLGAAPELAAEAFKVKEGQWLSKPFTVADGVVIARVAQHIAPNEKLWETQKGYLLQLLTQANENEIFQAFLTSLREKAEIKIAEPKVLE